MNLEKNTQKQALKKAENPNSGEVFDMDKLTDELWLKEIQEKEKIIKNQLAKGNLSLDDLDELYNKSNDYTVGIAIVECLPDIKNLPEEKKQIIANLLENFLSEKYSPDDFLDKVREDYYEDKNNFVKKLPQKWWEVTCNDYIYPGTQEFSDMIEDIYCNLFLEMKTKSVEKMAEFGNRCEQFILENLKKEIENNPLPTNIFPKKDYGKYKTEFDWSQFSPQINERGNLLDDNEKQAFDLYDLYQAYFSTLSEVGSNKSIDFMIDFIKNEKFSTLYHANELVELFDKIDRNYAVSKLLTMVEQQKLEIAQVYRIIQPLVDLINTKEVKTRFEKALGELREGKDGASTLAFILSSAQNQGYKVDFEKFKKLRLNIKELGQDMEQTDKDDVINMAKINWEKQNPKMAATVIEGLEKSLNDTSNQRCYTLKYNGKVISFIRFEEIDNETYYCGSFNVESELRGLGLGDEMMVMAIKNEAEKKKIVATASPRNVVGTCYVEKVGFVLDGYIADYHNTGEPLFNMKLDNKQNKNYAFRNEGKENKIDEEQIKKQCWTQENLDQIVGAETIVLKFDMQNEFEKMNSAMQKLLVAKDDSGKNVEGQNLENKYVITRYFQDNKEDKNNHTRYFVLEKI